MSDFLSIGFLLALIAAVIGLAAMTVRIAWSENSKVLDRMRDALQRMRLFKMLQKRRVDPQSYLRTTDAAEIRRQMAVCESCPSSQVCDAALESNETALDSFPFCPNDAPIGARTGGRQ